MIIEKNENEIYIYMDDSGKLNNNENSCIYGGIFFYSTKKYMNFINQYKSIIKSIKCEYCKQDRENCNKNCIEIKGTTKIKSKHYRRIFNLLKREYNFGVFINNKKVYSKIMKNKSARGRFSDYAQKRIIKEIVLYSIKNRFVDPNKELKIYIKMDECTTKTNGYYNLKDSIYEELVNGIINYDYSKIYKPLINSDLNLSVRMFDSKYNYGIQSADIMSNYLHRQYEKYLVSNQDISSTLDFIEVKLFLP